MKFVLIKGIFHLSLVCVISVSLSFLVNWGEGIAYFPVIKKKNKNERRIHYIYLLK